MATFTMVLKDVVAATDGHIGLDTYPIFDRAYREPLNGKIIDHFWNREIGQETIDMFQLMMRRKMNEIMPYYNQMYESELIQLDPLQTFLTESDTEQNTENDTQSQGTTGSTSTGKSRTVSSETPQTRLAGDEDYASAAQDSASESDASGTANDSSQGTSKFLASNSSRGYNGSPAQLLTAYRQTFLNVDMAVIDELEPLFMQVWSNGDEFTRDAYANWPLLNGWYW